MIIRAETSLDHHSIFEVNKLAFGKTDESQLINKIRKGNEFISELSLIAILEKNIVGHILFSKIKIKDQDKEYTSLALAPMAVLPEFQNKGIGSMLVQEGIQKAKKLGFDHVIVLGHKNYYPKFGFEKASKWNIKCPFEVPDENFMAIELKLGSLNEVEGIVEYSAAFYE